MGSPYDCSGADCFQACAILTPHTRFYAMSLATNAPGYITSPCSSTQSSASIGSSTPSLPVSSNTAPFSLSSSASPKYAVVAYGPYSASKMNIAQTSAASVPQETYHYPTILSRPLQKLPQLNLPQHSFIHHRNLYRTPQQH